MRSLVLIITTILFVSFSDHNGNGQHDPGEPFASGRYELYRQAADGAVDLIVVQYPPGVAYALELLDGDRVTAASGCGAWAVDVAAASGGEPVGVPVRCGSVLLPFVVAH